VSAPELLAGARSQREEGRIDALLRAFIPAANSEVCFRDAGRLLRHYRKSHGLDVPDALIAASAACHELNLFTLNV
jgi:predicted nucleic acid-binding protein